MSSPPTFDKCPRCNGEWKFDIDRPGLKRQKCFNCNMVYGPETDECMLALQSLLDHEHHLGWNFHSHTCMYASLINRIKDKGTVLPWLPFDITPEKLKKYLLFS